MRKKYGEFFMTRKIFCIIAALWLMHPSASALAQQNNPLVLSLDIAMEKALMNSPRLKGSLAIRGAMEGEKQQAGFLPNPELSAEIENAAGRGEYKGMDAAELTFGVSQLVEIGGKRSARVRMAEEGLKTADQDLRASSLDVMRDVTLAYIEAVSAEEQVKLAREQYDLANDTLLAVTRRVDSAADPVFQKNKAGVALATAKIALDKAEREVKLSKRKLSALWNGEDDGFTLDNAVFFNVTAPDEMRNLSPLLQSSPDYQRWDTELGRSKAAIELEQANAIPDPNLNFGVRDFRDSGDQAFVFGVSIPFPVLNQNQGNIAKAQHESLKIEADREMAQRDLTLALNRHLQDMENGYSHSVTIQKNILPEAEKAFAETRRGHGLGKFPYLEVLDAQRTLFDVKEQNVAALVQYHTARAEIERLIAAHQNKIKTQKD